MTTPNLFTVDGYQLAADRYYDEATHLWVETSVPGATVSGATAPGAARCGFDPLGSETSGDIVAVSFEPEGTAVGRGGAFGSLEAAKFVGPLIAPLSGTIRSHNPDVLAHPGLVNRDPLAHWLIEMDLARPYEELPLLLHDRDRVRVWFEREIERFKHQGAVAQ